jgi:cephalosporin hydroxylase
MNVCVNAQHIRAEALIEDMPADAFPAPSWGPGDNPRTAGGKYLETHPEFEIDLSIDQELMITVAPHGFLKRHK